jgi:hypothetical protein
MGVLEVQECMILAKTTIVLYVSNVAIVDMSEDGFQLRACGRPLPCDVRVVFDRFHRKLRTGTSSLTGTYMRDGMGGRHEWIED